MPLVSTPMPPMLIAELKRRAIAEDRSVASVVRRLLTRALLETEDSRGA